VYVCVVFIHKKATAIRELIVLITKQDIKRKVLNENKFCYKLLLFCVDPLFVWSTFIVESKDLHKLNTKREKFAKAIY
jgi:hypothetical protein